MNNLILAALITLQSLTVSMPGAPTSTIVPGAVIILSGPEWVAEPLISWQGATTLAGYTVTIGGAPCLLTYVGDEELALIVPALAPGSAVLLVTGPAGAYSADVIIVAAYPILNEQGGYAVASGHQYFYPVLYVRGEAIPVAPQKFNLIGLHVRGLQPETPVTVILDGPQRYEIPGTAHPIPQFYGVSNVLWFAKPCLNGTYAVSVRVGGAESAALPVRFTSDCRIEGLRPTRARR